MGLDETRLRESLGRMIRQWQQKRDAARSQGDDTQYIYCVGRISAMYDLRERLGKFREPTGRSVIRRDKHEDSGDAG